MGLLVLLFQGSDLGCEGALFVNEIVAEGGDGLTPPFKNEETVMKKFEVIGLLVDVFRDCSDEGEGRREWS